MYNYMEFLRLMSNHQVPKKNFAPSRYLFWLSPIIRLRQVCVIHIISLNQSINQPINQSINQWYTHQQRTWKQLWDTRNHLLSYLQVQYMPPATAGRIIHPHIYSHTKWRSFICQTSLQKIQTVFCINVHTFHKIVFNARELERGIQVLEYVGLLPYGL